MKNSFTRSTRKKKRIQLMIKQQKISDLKYEIEKISDYSPRSVTWIYSLNILSAVLSVVLLQFTSGTSLLLLIGIPLFSSFASIATSNYRIEKLTTIQTKIMVEGLESQANKQ